MDGRKKICFWLLKNKIKFPFNAMIDFSWGFIITVYIDIIIIIIFILIIEIMRKQKNQIKSNQRASRINEWMEKVLFFSLQSNWKLKLNDSYIMIVCVCVISIFEFLWFLYLILVCHTYIHTYTFDSIIIIVKWYAINNEKKNRVETFSFFFCLILSSSSFDLILFIELNG